MLQGPPATAAFSCAAQPSIPEFGTLYSLGRNEI